jgi:hypothetical chaperone protein
MSAVFGLDFGTTNSTLAVNRGGDVRIMDIDPTAPSATTLRSVLYFDRARKIFVGQEAIEHYLEDDARGRFMQSVKTLLSSKLFSNTVINNRPYALEDLVSFLLRTIKERGESIIGESVDTVVLGRPAVFSENEEENLLAESRLRLSAEKAGFKSIVFQFEPIAAALAYERSLVDGEEKKVLVGDFGGGTSDFTVIRLRGGASFERNRSIDILSLCGVPVGGDVFDSEIMSHRLVSYYGAGAQYKGMRGQWMEVPANIFTTLSRWHLIPQLRERQQREHIRQIRASCDNREAFERLEDLIDNNYGFKLFQAIERTKCRLSSEDDACMVFSELRSEIQETITREDFEAMIAYDLNKVEHSAEQALKVAGLTPADIDVVFITGGSSHIPSIRRIFIKKFGEKKLASADAFTSVGYGLGVAASHVF